MSQARFTIAAGLHRCLRYRTRTLYTYSVDVSGAGVRNARRVGITVLERPHGCL